MTRDMEERGSITVFMTFIFILLFALTGTVLDSARFFCSGGYMKVSAYGANVAIYGNYNRELFQEYGLFGYGGCGGMGEADWIEEYKQILMNNLVECPQEQQGLYSLFSRKYASIYRIGAVGVKLENVGYLTQEEQFIRQLRLWNKTATVKDVTQKLLARIQGTEEHNQQSLLDGLEQTARIEAMEKQKEEEQKEKKLQKEKSQEDKEPGEGADNPLHFLQKLVRDGVLALVCDVDSLAESEVYSREAGSSIEDDNEVKGKEEKSWEQRKSATGILKGLLGQSDSLWNGEMLQNQKKKGLLLSYASQMFGCYIDQKERSVPYGLEYIVSGKGNQRDAIAGIVNRLFLVRTLLNYAFVSGNLVLQEKSLTTATSLAAPLGAEALIPLLQQCILLILSLEEACVDITALLEGRLVPLLKDQTNFQMRYGEICSAGKTLFQRKAKEFPRAGEGTVLQNRAMGIGYIHYLWLFLLMTSWDKLYQRSLDIIQYDLREKYNQSFELDRCICQTKITVSYGMPLMASLFLVKKPESAIDREGMSHGMVMRQITTAYCYN